MTGSFISVVGPLEHAPAPPFSGCLVEAGVLPSRWFCCPPFNGTVTPSDFLPPLPLFGFSLIAASLLAGRISQVACKAFPTFRSPYAGGLAPLAPDSSAGSWPSPVDTRLGILLHLSVSHSRRGRIHLMLRTAGWFPHCMRFMTPFRAEPLDPTPGADFQALWRLPGQDLGWPSSAYSLTCWLYKPSLARCPRRVPVVDNFHDSLKR